MAKKPVPNLTRSEFFKQLFNDSEHDAVLQSAPTTIPEDKTRKLSIAFEIITLLTLFFCFVFFMSEGVTGSARIGEGAIFESITFAIGRGIIGISNAFFALIGLVWGALAALEKEGRAKIRAIIGLICHLLILLSYLWRLLS